MCKETPIADAALRLHRSTGVVDAHCDTVHLFGRRGYAFKSLNREGHLDLVRMQKGGVKLQFFAVYIEPQYKPLGALKRALSLISRYYRALGAPGERIIAVNSYAELEQAWSSGLPAALLAIEGGEVLEGELDVLAALYRLGVRCFGLTWNQRNQLADGISERDSGGGLTRFGRRVVAELNRLGMLVDAAHLAPAGFWDLLARTRAPVIVSHANAHALCPHPRNLTDEQLKGLAANGGVIGLSFYPRFVGDEGADLDRLVDHFCHIAALIGVDHLGIGSDFDGVDSLVRGIDDCSSLPTLTQALMNRGFSDSDLRKILSGNFLRLLQTVLKDGDDYGPL